MKANAKWRKELRRKNALGRLEAQLKRGTINCDGINTKRGVEVTFDPLKVKMQIDKLNKKLHKPAQEIET